MSRRRIRRHQETPELDITAFMNLMVVLVPFLLITAVFNQLVVLELNLPPDAAQEDVQQKKKKRLELELVVRKQGLELRDRNKGKLLSVDKGEKGYDFEALTKRLVKLKKRNTKIKDIAILLEPDTPYEVLVQVMDHVRVFHRGRSQLELFPEISIGDAPALEEQAS